MYCDAFQYCSTEQSSLHSDSGIAADTAPASISKDFADTPPSSGSEVLALYGGLKGAIPPARKLCFAQRLQALLLTADMGCTLLEQFA